METSAIFDFAPYLQRHERIVLELSAGKDSAACLWLLQPWWHKLVVVWCNPGNPYFETRDYMQSLKEQVPHFLEVHGEQPEWIAQHGWPSDVVPFESTEFGHVVAEEREVLLQPFQHCCSHNLWEPLGKVVTGLGATLVIRGQRDEEHLKGPVRSGQVVDGVEYLHPIESWSEREVLDYLGPRVPDSYKRGIPSSLDCVNCTAYLKGNEKRIEDLQETNPKALREVVVVHKYLRKKLNEYTKLLEA